MKVCPRCQLEYEESQYFCSQDGAALRAKEANADEPRASEIPDEQPTAGGKNKEFHKGLALGFAAGFLFFLAAVSVWQGREKPQPLPPQTQVAETERPPTAPPSPAFPPPATPQGMFPPPSAPQATPPPAYPPQAMLPPPSAPPAMYPPSSPPSMAAPYPMGQPPAPQPPAAMNQPPVGESPYPPFATAPSMPEGRPDAAAPAEPRAPLGMYRVTVQTPLRDYPSPDAEVVAKLRPGLRIRVVGEEGDYLEVHSQKGKKPGFVLKNHVAFLGEAK